jgi:hypothetical protein
MLDLRYLRAARSIWKAQHMSFNTMPATVLPTSNSPLSLCHLPVVRSMYYTLHKPIKCVTTETLSNPPAIALPTTCCSLDLQSIAHTQNQTDVRADNWPLIWSPPRKLPFPVFTNSRRLFHSWVCNLLRDRENFRVVMWLVFGSDRAMHSHASIQKPVGQLQGIYPNNLCSFDARNDAAYWKLYWQWSIKLIS